MTKANFRHVIKGNLLILVSYQTPVAVIDHRTGELYVTTKKWSSTTSRHISKFKKFCNYPTVVSVEQSVIDGIWSRYHG